jgi:O-antigen/teichoic acid export membrane protein
VTSVNILVPMPPVSAGRAHRPRMRLFRDSSFVLSGNVVQLFVSVASGVLIARTLGATGKGETYLALQIASLTSVLLAIGLGQSYQYHLRKELLDGGAIVSHILLQTAVVGVVVAAAYYFALPLLQRLTNGSLGDSLLALTLLLTVMTVLVNYFGFALMALDDGVKAASTYGAFGSIVYIVLLAGVLLTRPSVSGVIWCNLIAVMARAIPTIAKVVVRYRPGRLPGIANGMTASLFSYGAGSLAGNLMLTTVLRVDTFLVNAYLGAAAVGIYSVAVAIAEFVLMIPSAIGVALFPYLTSADDRTQVATVGRIGRLTAVLSIGSALALVAGSYPAIRLLFGAGFGAAYPPLLALLPGLVALSLVYSYANFFSSRGNPWVNAVVFGGATLVDVVANILLLPQFGVIGASIASSVAYFVAAAAFVLIIAARQLVSHRELYLPRTEDFVAVVRQLRDFRPGSARF